MPDPVILIDDTTRLPVSLNSSAGLVVDVTPVLDTAAYAAGDSFFIPTAITGTLTAAGRMSLLQSLEIIDKSGTGPTLEICFYESLVASFGAANAAMALSDADTLKELGYISIAAADWKTRANNKVLCLKNIGLVLKAASGVDRKLVTAVNVFDVFEGASVGEGKKSVAIEVHIQPVERTLQLFSGFRGAPFAGFRGQEEPVRIAL